jgi:hypothetical protein
VLTLVALITCARTTDRGTDGVGGKDGGGGEVSLVLLDKLFAAVENAEDAVLAHLW